MPLRYNSHHAHWHTVNRGGNGGVFAYMHQQMLSRSLLSFNYSSVHVFSNQSVLVQV